jgi:hypothetical protein
MRIQWIAALILAGFGLGLGGFSTWAAQQSNPFNFPDLTWPNPTHWLAQTPTVTAEVIDQKASGSSQNRLCSYTVHYPQVMVSGNPAVQAQINTYLKDQFFRSEIEYLQPFDLENCATKIGHTTGLISFSEVIKYSVELNQKGILSLRYYASSVQKQQEPAQPQFMFYTPTKTLTLNLRTGKPYTYQDLFLPGKTINQLIETRTRQQYGLAPGDGRGPTPDTYSFYLDQRGLVIINLFPQRALAAAHLVIHPSEIADVINPQGPLSLFLP